MVETQRYMPNPGLSDEEWKARIVLRHPQSILTKTGEINRLFGGSLPDEAPIEVLVTFPLGDDARFVELTQLWDVIDLNPKQKEEIAKAFTYLKKWRNGVVRTIGDIRVLANQREIRKIPDLDRIKDIWFAYSFRKAESLGE